ncbi:MAG: DUF4249 domain-containing protein [Bacteroidota bacterium]
MKKLVIKLYSFLGLLTLILFSACEDVIIVDAPEGAARLVVEGWVYDNQDVQTILLTNSSPYFDNQTPPLETNAQVSVTTQTGEVFAYSETSPGEYQADFRGSVGERYTLTIETSDGQRYQSTSQLLSPVAPLDSVYAVFRESPEVEDEGFYPAWDFTDPEGSDNFYRWKFYINDTLQSLAEDILVFSDEFIDGDEIVGAEFFLEQPMEEGDKLTVEQLSINEEAQDFLTQIQQLINNVGGLFDTPPDPIRGNITNTTDEENYALGFFGASSVAGESVVVGE